ncbi:DUF2125 domain-containing protein [Roseibium sp. MMSF_3544]|uniref:DUF2125 domain-containing protein n=1 Tax=unclassified Roseibium TaxID=2629323 RepID=UPI00273CFFBC|nr:DUF2125 domain-containing protein [Roseibium sp. MMSF_3544]
MSENQNKPAKSSRRRYIILLCIIFLVIAGWSGAWMFGRSILSDQLDQQLQAMARGGVDVSCADLSIGGYPFRYEVYCRDLVSRDQTGAAGSLGALNAVALIYNPRHIIFEAHAPASVAEPLSGLLGEMKWETARASVKFSDAALGALDAVLQKPEAAVENSVSSGLFSADKAELHLRKTPDQADAVDGFVSVDALQLKSLPEIGETIDLRGHLQVPGGAALLAGADLVTLVRMNDGRLPVKLVLMETVIGESRLGASGDLVINGNGTLSGNVAVTIGNADGLLQMLKPLFPPQDNSFSLVESVVQSLKAAETDVEGVPSITLPMVIDEGIVRVGFLTLGRVPPFFSAGT